MTSQYFKLRDVFTWAASNVRQALKLDGTISTYRFLSHDRMNVTDNGEDTGYYIKCGHYHWAEARKIDDDKYSLWMIVQNRHNYGFLNVDTSQRLVDLDKKIFTKEQVIKELKEIEQIYMDGDTSILSFQPTKAIHFSREEKGFTTTPKIQASPG